MYIHERIETRQSTATMPEDNSLFLKRKRRASSGGTRTRDVLHTRQMLHYITMYVTVELYTCVCYPTEMDTVYCDCFWSCPLVWPEARSSLLQFLSFPHFRLTQLDSKLAESVVLFTIRRQDSCRCIRMYMYVRVYTS